MGQAIGQVLALAVVVSLSPIPIIAVVVMLGTPRARANGPSFLVGWLAGIAALGTVVLLASSAANAGENGSPATWASILRLVLAFVLLRLAVTNIRSRPKGEETPEMPKWMATVDTFSPAKSAGLGVLLSAVNPKNLIIVVAAATAIAQTEASTADEAVALAVFTLVATVGPSIPVGIYFLMGDRAPALLANVKETMARHNAVIMAVICLVIAAKLAGDGISGLTG